jgi:prephenate dehydratase
VTDSKPLLTYLGPAGTFTHGAVDLLAQPWSGSVEPRSAVADVIFSVESGEAAAGVVPLETSVEGDVSSTIDELIFRSSMCFINEEIIVPISYVAAGQAGSRIENVQRLFSTSAAISQCRRFVESLGALVTLVPSNAAACAAVATSQQTQDAALTTAIAAKQNQLAILRGVAEDHSGVSTRMALLSRRVSEPTGHDRTSFVVTPIGDRTGVLVEILQCFAARDIALTSISSRPLRTRAGEYSFLLTARGHIADERIQKALQAAAELPAELKILGSYPLPAGGSERRGSESAPPGSVTAEALGNWMETLLAPQSLET